MTARTSDATTGTPADNVEAKLVPSEWAACPVCSNEGRCLTNLADDRYGYPGSSPLFRCDACGHRFLSIEMSPEELASLYTNFYPRSTFDVDSWSPPTPESALRTWWRGLRASAFRWVPANVRVLDIGCGFGESLGYHRDRGCDAHGVEADSNILRVAERHGLQVRVGLFDPQHYEPGSFDVVTLDQVIEHVSDPVAVLSGVWQVLRPGGTLVLSTPNADGWGARVFGGRWIHWHAPYHQQFFSKESMGRAAERAEFRVESRSTITNASWLTFQWGHLMTLAAPGARSVYWNRDMKRTSAQRVLLAFVALTDRLGVNAAITRLFDALGQGDNVVFVLRKQSA